MGVSSGIQKSPSLLRNGSLQSNSGSTPTGPGERDTASEHIQNTKMFYNSDSLTSWILEIILTVLLWLKARNN